MDAEENFPGRPQFMPAITQKNSKAVPVDPGLEQERCHMVVLYLAWGDSVDRDGAGAGFGVAGQVYALVVAGGQGIGAGRGPQQPRGQGYIQIRRQGGMSGSGGSAGPAYPASAVTRPRCR